MITITTTVDSIPRIQAEARAAALEYAELRDACPYPFGSMRARIFSNAFNRAREQMRAARQPIEGTNP